MKGLNSLPGSVAAAKAHTDTVPPRARLPDLVAIGRIVFLRMRWITSPSWLGFVQLISLICALRFRNLANVSMEQKLAVVSATIQPRHPLKRNIAFFRVQRF